MKKLLAGSKAKLSMNGRTIAFAQGVAWDSLPSIHHQRLFLLLYRLGISKCTRSYLPIGVW